MSKKSIGIIKDYTPNFSFKIPNFNIATWHDFIESNFRSIDALFYNLFGINNFKGEWTKITTYKAGEVIFIGEDKDINGKTTEYSGRLVKVLKDHTTDNSDYFNIFYSIHQDYYELFFDANNAEYFSEKAFEYKNEANNYLKASQELNTMYQQYLADTQKAKEAAQKSEQNAKTSEQNAQNASTTAINTVKVATDLLNSTQTFTENAVEEINNTKNATISTITNIKNEVSQQIDEKIVASEQIIDEKIETAQNDLDTTITNAIIAAKDEVKQEADIAIENASTVAADYAKVKLDTYVDKVIEPPLQNYVDSAESFKNAAENSKNLAKTEATNSANSASLAKISEQNAKTYENSTNNYKKDAQTYANTSKSWADKAEQAVEDCQAIKNSLGSVYVFCGSVQTFNDLPTTAKIGDVYNIIETGANYAKIENGWDNLGMDIDLSIYAKKTDLNSKQDKLTAGTGIKIENNVVSNTQTSAEWGNIKGTLSNQTDLQNALNNKVSKTGDETITGAKTFLGITIRNKCSIADSTASTISSTEEKGLLILDIKGNRIGNFYGGQLADGNLRTYMCACRSVNGSVVYQYAQIKQASDGTGVFSINCNSALAPTPPTGDNSTKIATTQWVRNVVADNVSYEDLDEDVTINPTPIREEWQAFQNTINNLISSLEVELNKVKSVRYVVEKGQNGNRWYTLYSDGWCEQGGKASVSGEVVTFLKPFKDTNYNAQVTPTYVNTQTIFNWAITDKTTSTMKINSSDNSGVSNRPCDWEAKGYIK